EVPLRHDLAAVEGQPGRQQGVGLLGVDHKRPRVGRLDPVDRGEDARHQGLEVRIVGALDAELRVGGRERVAVVEADAGAQAERPRGGRGGLPLGRQAGMERVVGVAPRQVVEEVERDPDVVRGRGEVRVELRDVAALADHQLAALGGLAGGGPSRAGAERGRGGPDPQGGSALEERAPREPAGPPRRHQVVEIHGALLVGSECRAGIVAGALFRPRASLAGRTPRRAWTSMSGVPPALLSRGAGPSQGPGRAAAATMGTRPVVRPPVPAREDTVADRDLCFTPAGELVRLFRSRRASPLEVVQAVLARIDAVNPGLNAYVTVARESALAAARRATAALRRGVVLPPLHGVPGSIKDLTPTAGIRTTWGSRIFEHHVPAED